MAREEFLFSLITRLMKINLCLYVILISSIKFIKQLMKQQQKERVLCFNLLLRFLVWRHGTVEAEHLPPWKRVTAVKKRTLVVGPLWLYVHCPGGTLEDPLLEEGPAAGTWWWWHGRRPLLTSWCLQAAACVCVFYETKKYERSEEKERENT